MREVSKTHQNIEAALALVLKQDRRALAKFLSLVENREEGIETALAEIYKHGTGAHVVGITGAPGVGKSTLVSGLLDLLSANGKKVGVLAIDPSSPFGGGAILGDRIRMHAKTTRLGVFIRSLSARGQTGGLSRAAGDMIAVMDAFGMDYIIVETVGAGQAEVDIKSFAETTIVVLAPGLGDAIQSIKAGILEIADIFVVNKSDLPGAHRVVLELENLVSLSRDQAWKPAIVEVSAKKGQGIEELCGEISEHRRLLGVAGRKNELKRRRMRQFADVLVDLFSEHVEGLEESDAEVQDIVHRVKEGEIDPYRGAKLVFNKTVRF